MPEAALPPQAEPRPTRRKVTPFGCFWVCGGFLLLMLFLTIGGGWYYFTSSRWALDAELAKIAEQGDPVTADGLNAEYRVANAENDPTSLWLAALDIVQQEPFRESSLPMPLLGPDVPSAELPDGAWENQQEIETFLADNAALRDTIARAGAFEAPARFPIDFHDGYLILLPHAQEMRSIARFLKLEAHLKARHEDSHGVAMAIHDMFMSALALSNEPILVSQLVTVAIHHSACETFMDLLPFVDFSDADLAMLKRDVRRFDFKQRTIDSLKTERIIAVHTVENMAGNPEEFGAQAPNSLLLLNRYNSMVVVVQRMNADIQSLDEPWPQALAEMRDHDEERLNAKQNSMFSGWGNVLADLFAPATRNSAEAMARGDFHSQATEAIIAAEQFRRKNDRLPDSLEELTPDFLPQVPSDPFDGKPIRFVKVGPKELKLYSIGRNMADDGGVDMEAPPTSDEVFQARFP